MSPPCVLPCVLAGLPELGCLSAQFWLGLCLPAFAEGLVAWLAPVLPWNRLLFRGCFGGRQSFSRCSGAAEFGRTSFLGH